MAVKNGLVIPVLSFIHVLEFSNRTDFYQNEVTAYLDSVQALAPIRWIKGLPAVVKAEVSNAFLGSIGVSPLPLDPLVDHLVDTLKIKLPWFDRAEAKTYNISRIVQESSSISSREEYQKFRMSSPVFDIPRLRALKDKNPTGYLVHDIAAYAADFLGKRVITPEGILVDVTSESLEQFKIMFRLSTCPAFSFKLAFFEGWSMSTGGEEASMFEDLYHLVALAYCDVVFVDSATWEALKKGKAARMPLRNGEFLAWVEGLGT